jgi:hypothetical protein
VRGPQVVMSPACAAAAGPSPVVALRRLQALLVGGRMSDLAEHLYGTLVAPPTATTAEADAGGDAGGGGSAANPERRWRSVALSCHLMLALEALGALTGQEDVPPGGGAAAADAFEMHRCAARGRARAACHACVCATPVYVPRLCMCHACAGVSLPSPARCAEGPYHMCQTLRGAADPHTRTRAVAPSSPPYCAGRWTCRSACCCCSRRSC